MSLNRAQKRNLALLLVARAKSVIADWDNVSSKSYTEIENGGLKGITQEDVRDVYAQWLGYLPNHAWDRVEEPSSSPSESDPPADLDPPQTYEEPDGRDQDHPHSTGAVLDHDENAVEGLSEHVNPALSEETPVMGSNEIVHENEVLYATDEDADPTGDEQVVQQASAGGPQPFQYR